MPERETFAPVSLSTTASVTPRNVSGGSNTSRHTTSDWEELELDWAEIKRVTTFVVGVSERLANIRDLWMPTEDRLVLVYEQLGRAAQRRPAAWLGGSR